MQNVSWLAFAYSNSLTKPMVHFIPSARGTGAPYPVSFNVTVFSASLGSKSLVLDGGRLGQPDGVRLDDAFPCLKENSPGLFGVEVEISTLQPRTDLTTSSCVVELLNAGSTVKFSATMNAAKADETRTITAPIINDAFWSTSLVVANAAAQPLNLKASIVSNGDSGELSMVPTPQVLSCAVQELALPDISRGIEMQECSWGIMRKGALRFEDFPPTATMYAVYRDASSKKIMSVSAL